MKTILDKEHRALIGMGSEKELEVFADMAGVKPENAIIVKQSTTDAYKTVFMNIGEKAIFVIEDKEEGCLYSPLKWEIIEDIFKDFKEHDYKTASLRGQEEADKRGYKENTSFFHVRADSIVDGLSIGEGKHFLEQDAMRTMPEI